MIMTETNQALQGIRPFIEEQMKIWNVPGLAVAVVKDQEIIIAEGFGYRDVEARLEVTPETLFAIGSSTKAFAATTAGILADEGKLDIDTPVKHYLPNFKMVDSFTTERVTLRDMLSHRTGLPRHDLIWFNSSLSRKEIIERIQYLEPNRDFRTTWQYQNIMYMVAGYIVGQQLGTSWEQVVKDKIFAPLQMHASNFSVDDSQLQSDYALPYMDEGDQVKRIPFRNLDLVGPAGSINSNLLDMAKWVMLQLNKGVYQGQQVISEGALMETHRPHIPCELSYWGMKELTMACYGLGWWIEPYRGHPMIHHGGNIDGFTAEVAFLPDEKVGVVILANKNITQLPMLLSFNLFDRLLGLDELDWTARVRGTTDSTEKQVDSQEETEETRQASTEAEVLVETIEPETPPTHQLHEYAGTYSHPGYGDLVVEFIDDRLHATYNSIQLLLARLNHHAFELEYTPFQVKLPATFHTDIDDRIDRIAVKMLFEPGTKDIEFVKK